MKCIVTGATGHIGNVLVKKLLELGHDVTAFVMQNDSLEPLKDLSINICYGDVRNYDSLFNAFKNMDIVFHLAGIIEIGSFNKKRVYDVNVNGSKNVVLACKAAGVKRLVYTSSVHAIEPKPNNELITETKNFSPKFVKGTYAKTKAEATKYILDSADDNLEVVVVHPSGVIGPFEYIKSNLGQLIEDCITGRMKAYIKGGYNFVDVRDVVDGIISAALKGKSSECYILAGSQVTVRQLMLYVEEITGVRAPKVKLATWFAYATGFLSEIYYKIVKEKPLFTAYSVYTLGTNSNFSIDKAKRELGYSPRDIKDTLKDTIDWMQEINRVNLKH